MVSGSESLFSIAELSLSSDCDNSKARTLHSCFALFDSSSSCDSVKLGDLSLEKFVFDFWVQNHGSIAPAKNSRLSPLPPERASFNYGIGETVDIPIDGSGDLKKRERELQAKEAELRKCEEIVKRKEDAAARG
ncbi:secretory carrier-associated membrane protein 5-like [Rosa chinensis]|uniref:secretory carrier-associated membrane protein 5-like n=1 Tax=Rosa chinensis TaxID=74649 RepID=UPI001AD8AC24|nr:secretory carrier-associated membrane protein 5-like [Rosa chinensis]